jgi:hypothetical protein
MKKETSEPTSSGKNEQPVKKVQNIQYPAQKTFIIPFFVPGFIVDRIINKWIRDIVIETRTMPMLNKIGSGPLFNVFGYMYTKTDKTELKKEINTNSEQVKELKKA